MIVLQWFNLLASFLLCKITSETQIHKLLLKISPWKIELPLLGIWHISEQEKWMPAICFFTPFENLWNSIRIRLVLEDSLPAAFGQTELRGLVSEFLGPPIRNLGSESFSQGHFSFMADTQWKFYPQWEESPSALTLTGGCIVSVAMRVSPCTRDHKWEIVAKWSSWTQTWSTGWETRFKKGVRHSWRAKAADLRSSLRNTRERRPL